ncbi:OmpP1/FadL family transporter [Persicitalea jodogahamensis]|uniref:Transporter n=1 Tax=Persicitalea jodogahamensis TaxID=402147 RepID=A0A8J3DDH5_9BACT|nr:hypothetical protein [Persicitalea jodogahamensis]GHB80427.1 transporter [Persicitalea jodogahamensis]
MNIIKLSLLAGAALLLAFPSRGQYAADAFRFSEINQTGTARFQGVGGNHAALGGDASTISGNPAGLGFYNRSELSLSPSFRNLNTESTYLGRVQSDGKTNPNLTQASLIIAGSPNRYNSNWKRSSIGISYTRQQSFQNLFSYSGRNERSAFVDAAVDDANRRNISAESLDQEFDVNSRQAFTLPGAYYQLYMINPTTAVGPPYVRYERNNPTDQVGSFESTGAHSQWTFAYAGNYNDKIYVGASIGFNRIRYDYNSTLSDQYANATVIRGSTHTEDLNVTGNGINATIGIIYKATPQLQIGASITSPTFMNVKETFNELVQADIIGIPQTDANGQTVFFVPDVTTVGLQPNDFEYTIQSPLRASGGVTYFFGQSGFLTGTVEYVGYRGMRVSTGTLNAADNSTFRQDNKREIEDTYTGGVNVRVGGEYRAGTFRARAGLAYLGDPYRVKLDDIDRSKLLLSGGIGFRNERFFADVTGIYNTAKAAYTPYVLNNQSDYASARITSQSINLLITLGTFF